MKAQISRESHRPSKRYSGVYHIQGAMVTDADLDERSVITRERTDNLGDDTVRDGVPEIGGAVTMEDGNLVLREGIIYADGVRGVLTGVEDFKPEKPLDLFNQQADLPEGPALPEDDLHIIYADIWERPVFPLEDPYLADAGLHGAVTGFRTRTMTQIKAAPADAEADIEAGTGAFPQIGSARMAITPLNAEILADDCDPCAEVVSAGQEVANALWRLEVIAIEGTPDKPERIVLAWSEENAGEIAPATVSQEVFERAGKVYEFFSPITESHAGVFANAGNAKRSAFVADLSDTPSPAKDHNGEDWPFVRRWDGHAVVDTNSGNVTDTLGDGFDISMAGSTITLQVTAFVAEIDIADAAVMRGDYWLVELRRHAPETERIRLVKETPVGILHHYCTLFTAKGQEIQQISDARHRKLSFPALTDLPADHVGFDNSCAKLYGDAENVQEALDNLCDISAEDIGFESNCPALYDDAKTVQEALDALCSIDFSVHDSFRLLFDWGVVCGIVPKLVKNGDSVITISAGAYLDRSGRLTKFAGGEFDLNELKIGDGIVFETPDDLARALAEEEACLALAAEEGGKTRLFVVPQALAFGPDDPGFAESVRRCVEKKKVIDIKDLVAKLPEQRKTVASRIFLASTGDGAFKGSARLTRAEFAEANAFHDTLTESFSQLATPQETEILKARVEQARADNPLGNLSGSALEVRQMQQAAAIFAAFAETDEERLRRCLCEALFPTCPPDLGKAPYFVPIACLEGKYDEPSFFVTELCPYCCRKQAMTWRSLQYFIGDGRAAIAKRFAAVCCGTRRTDTTPPKGRLQYDPGRYAQMDFGRFAEENELVNTFLDRAERLPSDFVTKVDVNDLSQEEAQATLRGTGVEVVETIDVDDAKAFELLEKRFAGVSPTDLLVSAGNVRPGDKVALLVQDGVARGYVLVEQGTGKLPFEAAKAATLKLPDGEIKRVDEFIRDTEVAKAELAELGKTRETLAKDVDALKSEIDALGKERDATTQGLELAGRQLAEMSDTREALVKDIGDLKADFESLVKERDTTAEGLEKTGSQLAELTTAREKLSGEIASAAEELRIAEANRDAMIEAVRDGQPVTAIIGNKDPELVAKLAGEGIITAGDIARLKAADITRLDRNGILKRAEADELKTKAGDFLKRRIG